MRIDPELLALLPSVPVQDFRDLATCRAMSADVRQPFDRQSYPGLIFDDITIDGPKRSTLKATIISNPETRTQAPMILHIHGGGFALGDPSFDESENAAIVSRTGVTIASPDYRLAPEHPFPAAFDDCCAALEWMSTAGPEWAEPGRPLAVMGHSAGGSLAAAVALWARDVANISLRAQFLLEPVLDPRLQTISMTQMVDAPIWYRSNAELSWQFYLAGQEPTQFSAPALAETLTGLPRTYLTVNQTDPLRDEGLAYAARLMADGVLTESHCWPGAVHGFTAFESAAITRRAIDQLVEVIDTYLF